MSKRAARVACENADQLEAYVVASGAEPLIRGLTDDTIAEDDLVERYDPVHGPDASPEWDSRESARDQAVADLQVELARRATLLGDLYPFDILDRGTLLYRPEASPSQVYEFCLAISTLTPGDRLGRKPCALVPRVFERLVGRLLAAYLGSGSEYYRLGWPPDGDRPGTMAEALRDLRRRTREWEFHPPQGADAQPLGGDDGIDLAVWRRFGSPVFDTTIDPVESLDLSSMAGDARVGMIVLLAQCACGDDWVGKRKELCPLAFEKTWGGVISAAGQLRCMAIPRHVPHPADWRDSSCEAGILLDRVRLTWMAATYLTAEAAADLAAILAPHIAALRATPSEVAPVTPAAPPGRRGGGRARTPKARP